MIDQIKQALFSFFFSPVCPCCKELNSSNQYFCSLCLQLVELSIEKKESLDRKFIEIFCFENMNPMRSFYQRLLKEKHPKKIEIAISFFLVQIANHNIEVDKILCLHKRGSLFYILSKILSKRLHVPLEKDIRQCDLKKILFLGDHNSHNIKANTIYALYFLAD